ncbi:MAG: DUF1772 domain-containing protein [Steroidobacteraceae bacterium]
MDLFDFILILATLLCTLTAGFVFAFASVVMPGIRNLSDRGFIRAFQVIDGVIQRGQPIFGLVWMGSAVALLVAAVLGFWRLDGIERALLVIATLIYLFGVQAPTFAINVPLNNKLQALDVDAIDDAVVRAARTDFEGRWVLWNSVRTVLATSACALLLTAMSIR